MDIRSPSEEFRMLAVGTCAALACLLEASAPKPGNVHRGADFEDLTYLDLVGGGILIGPEMEQAPHRGVGETLWASAQVTAAAIGTNANLGIILLLAPLAKVPRPTTIEAGIGAVLEGLTVEDARLAYRAIRLLKPSGLGQVVRGDVSQENPDCTLLEAMRLAANRDLVARQYAHAFADVLDLAAPQLIDALSRGFSLPAAIVQTHLRLLADLGDSLIERKCGPAVARQAQDRAAHVLGRGNPEDEAYQRELAELDFWLRSDGHRRNPGTTADLVAAALFVLLREGKLSPPWPFYASRRPE